MRYWFIGIFMLSLLATEVLAFDFSSSGFINARTYFRGNGTVAFPDRMNLANGFNISTIFLLDDVHHEYIIWSRDRYLLQITEDGYIQSGLWANNIWYPLVTYPRKAEKNKTYDVYFSYNNSDAVMVVNGYNRSAKFETIINNSNTITYIGNRNDWARDFSGYIEYLSVIPFANPGQTSESCGDGSCSATESNQNCQRDCFIQMGARDLNVLYHTKNETIRIWKNLVTTHPTVGSYEVIGKSLGNQDIWLFMFGNPNGGKVMVDSQGHGIEDCGNEIGYTFVKWLLDSNTSEANRILKENYVMFIPVLNVDKYVRQNSRRNYTLANGSILSVPYGVDLNRNGLFGFGGSGSGNASHNYEYRGLSAGSEPEIQALAYAQQKYKPDIYVNTHCGMNLLNACKDDNLTRKIIAQIKNSSSASIQKYHPAFQCTGGYIMSQAHSFGASSWILEIARWDELPNSLVDYNAKFYPLVSPIFISMCNAVGVS